MRTVVVTGPIGAGKSSLTALLAAAGAAVVDGDRLGHEVLGHPEVRDGVAREFGPDTVGPEGVDRRALGALVFGDEAAMGRLNALTHQRLSDLMSARLDLLAAAGDHALAVLEAAVYFLLPSPPQADLVVAVLAAADTRSRRLMRRDGLSPEAVAARMKIQAGMDVHWDHADLVVANDGKPAMLRIAVAEIFARLGLDP